MVRALGTGGSAGNAGFSITMLPSAAFLQGALNRYVGDIRSVGQPGGPIDQAIREVIIPRIEDNFDSRTAAGEEWADWSENTPFMPYHKKYESNIKGILEVTGTLRSEATTLKIWERDGQEGTAFVRASSFTRAPYAQFMQEGAPNNTSPHGYPAPIPARPFILINKADIDDIDNIFHNWLTDRVGHRLGTGQTVVEASL